MKQNNKPALEALGKLHSITTVYDQDPDLTPFNKDVQIIREALTQTPENVNLEDLKDMCPQRYMDDQEGYYPQGWFDCLKHIVTKYPNGVRIEK